MDKIWPLVVAELCSADSPYPPLSAQQKAFLKITHPVALVPGYAVIATPHAMARDVIEKELAGIITDILTRKVGQPLQLAVSVTPEQPHAETPPAHENPAPTQPAQPTQTHTQSEDNSSQQWNNHQATQQQPSTPQYSQTHSYTEQPEQQQQPAQPPVQRPDLGVTPGQYDSPGQMSAADLALELAKQQSHQAQQPAEAQPSYQQQPQQEQPPMPDPTRPVQHTGEPHVEPTWAHVAEAGATAANTQQSGTRPPLYVHPEQRLSREKPAHDPNAEGTLNPKYTFDSFVIGSSNRFAHAAAVAVAESPANAFNPLFIWGGSGLGKTHLLHAAGNYAQILQPGLRVKYVSSEEFTNDYINSVRDDRQESFKRRYRNLDILMVDDIQFLVGKEGTQEEFFHTFNALHQANKQIVLSSDRPPKQLTTLTDRLRTRFEGGLITDIQPPDLETRIAILSKKAQIDGTTVSRDVLELIASRFESSIRELEGALIRVAAYSSLIKEPIDMNMAEVALRDIMPEAADVVITPQMILEATSEYFEVPIDVLRGSSKIRNVVRARQLAMYLCRELTELSLPKIGEAFGKDHSTVIHAVRKISETMSEDRSIYDEVQVLTQNVKNRGRAIPS
ncbi:hypothetical protein CAQU_00005 [Corynebacterium aquilae DSM 44791]|uniref:Chromosomal replication initiator protein DnaA n=1 Tax=Corynebacterium aquilae DSM 44791 TaxID=1431546 RepID=A0A1L7CD02_9CORY|nr:hypothetical protein CAQU_00005 [Corynebacterium aquilae DSM 44791]